MTRALLLSVLGFAAGCGPPATSDMPGPQRQTQAARVDIPDLGSDAEDEANTEAVAAVAGSKLEQCARLVDFINNSVEAVENIGSSSGSGGLDDLREMGRTLARISDELGALTLTVPELQAFARRYQNMANGVALASRRLAAAAEQSDVEAVAHEQARMDRASRREDPLVEEINGFCQASGATDASGQDTKR